MNDSQNTTLTEPDDVPAGLSFPISATPSMTLPVVRRLTKEEAREKAEALKLRLRLASYRVFTNREFRFIVRFYHTCILTLFRNYNSLEGLGGSNDATSQAQHLATRPVP